VASFTSIKVVELTNSSGFPRRFACAEATSIEKYALLTLSDPRTAATRTDTPTAAGLICAGIAAMDKTGGDGSISITAYTDGIFEIRASGAINAGAPVMSCGAGEVCLAPTTASGAIICGYALETAADQETINVRFRV